MPSWSFLALVFLLHYSNLVTFGGMHFLWQAEVNRAYMSVIISISTSCTNFILSASKPDMPWAAIFVSCRVGFTDWDYLSNITQMNNTLLQIVFLCISSCLFAFFFYIFLNFPLYFFLDFHLMFSFTHNMVPRTNFVLKNSQEYKSLLKRFI